MFLQLVYFLCFSHVYNYCTNVNNQGIRGRPGEIATSATKAKKNQANGGAQFVGHELYKKLKDYLKDHLKVVKEVSDFFVCHI